MRELVSIGTLLTTLATTTLVAAHITAWFLIYGGRHGIALATLAATCAMLSGIAGATAESRR